MKRFHSILAGLALAILSTPTWAIQIPVSGDTAGSTVKNTITKAAGKATTLPVSGKSTGLLFFDLSSSGIDSSAVTGARLVIYLSKVTKPGNLNVAFPTTAFQETFTTATIPLPTVGGTGTPIPITPANNKGYVVIAGFQSVVQSWLDTPSTNLGIALTGDAALNVLLTAKEGSVGASAVLEIDVNPSGTLDIASVTAAGPITAGSFSTDGALNVFGNSTFNNDVTIANKTLTISGTGSLNVGGDVSATGNVLGDFFGSSSMATDNLTVHVNSTLKGQTNLQGDVTLDAGKVIGGAGAIGLSGLIGTTGQMRATTVGIGINTANSANKQLQILSSSIAEIDVRTTNGSSFAGVNTTNVQGSWFLGTRSGANQFTIFDNNAGANRFIIDGSGNIGIGADPIVGFPLRVNGQIVCTAVIETSDARFKKDIAPITGALDQVEKLRGVSYLWRTDEFPDRKFDDRRHLGFIAQEIREILPEVVKEDHKGQLSVQYTGVIPVLVNAIQELKAEKDAEIAALQARLARLEASLGEGPAQATTAALELK